MFEPESHDFNDQVKTNNKDLNFFNLVSGGDKKLKIDWSGQKYLLLKEKGYDVNIYFNRITTLNNQTVSMDWYHRCHSKSDGVGAFTALLSRLSGKNWEQPRSQKIPKPFFLKIIWEFLKYLWSTRYINYEWKHFQMGDSFLKERDSKGQSPKSDFVTTLCFNNKNTQQLINWSKENKISLNSLLIWSLDCVVRSTFLKNNLTRSWLIPVNMRGGVSITDPSSNYTASINLKLFSNLTPNEVDNKIKRLYTHGQQWGAWLYSNFSKYFPTFLINHFFKNYKSCWLGVFSNLGTWNDNKNDTMNIKKNKEIESQTIKNPGASGDTVRWGAVSPSTLYNPIAVVALTWNNQLTLNLRIHPSLFNGLDIKKQVFEFSQSWTHFLLSHCQIENESTIYTSDLNELSKRSVEF